MIHPYSTLAYGRSLPGDGTVVMSETLGVPLRLRPIPDTDLDDAAGLYPLSPDLKAPTREALRAELQGMGAVSLVLVSDPLETAPGCFDIIRPYKPHHVIDPGLGPPRFSRHHRAEVRRARRACDVGPIVLADHFEAFARLYDVLIARHDLGPQHRFGRAHFAHLAAHPREFPTFGAFRGETLVSAHVWVRHGLRVYSHLAASDAAGYRVGAAYAVYDCAIAALSGGQITLGGVPDGPGGAGLDRFKRGFANATRMPHLCGLIADPEAYAALSPPDAPGSGFFPNYRRA